MFERYTEKARRVIFFARYEASQFGSPYIETEHLLLGLLREDKALANRFLRSHAAIESIRKQIESHTTIREKVSTSVDLPLSHECKRVLAYGAEEAERLNHKHIGTEHLLLGLLREEKSFAAEILHERGLRLSQVREEIQRSSSEKVASNRPKESSLLAEFSRDLTQAAVDGALDPLIGRDYELDRVIQILCRRTKNNPVLIGEPGVGKTAIVEGLAQRIAEGDVPSFLADKRILALDLSLIVAGTKYRGQFEERLKTIMKELMENQNAIIFIDELHTIVGAGAAEGAVDASNMLKPPLARGELHVIGATTLDEYRKHIEKDPALERRFQPVLVGEPSVADTIAILRGLKEKYEVHHGVRITDNALVAAATLSDRYIGDRFLPDKAIDLVDEAASRLRIEIDSLPQEIDEVERRIVQLEIQRQALLKEKDKAGRERLATVEQEISALKERSAGMKAQWQSEKSTIQEIQSMKQQVEALRTEVDQATRHGDLQKAAELRYGRIPELEQKLGEQQGRLAEVQATAKYLKEEVDAEDIAQIVAKWTGIPVSRMLESERARLTRLEAELARRVVGQEAAVTAVANAVRRSRAGLQDPNRPTGSFIFLGPTGVGKTETARALAEFLFDDERAMVRLDMSEYMEKHSVARMIGAPPGYVGYEEGGQLTEAVRRRPYSVILFDEIEKAHPDIFNILLQILDDGRLTDSQGRVVDFRNTVIIMTSNIGSQYIVEAGTTDTEEEWRAVEARVRGELRQHFRPEFLNRVDDVIVFRRLTRDDLNHIVALQLAGLEKLLGARHLHLRVTPEARELLANQGYDPVYGARPLKRVIQRELQNPIAMEVLEGRYHDGDTIVVERNGAGLQFSRAGTPLEAASA